MSTQKIDRHRAEIQTQTRRLEEVWARREALAAELHALEDQMRPLLDRLAVDGRDWNELTRKINVLDQSIRNKQRRVNELVLQVQGLQIRIERLQREAGLELS